MNCQYANVLLVSIMCSTCYLYNIFMSAFFLNAGGSLIHQCIRTHDVIDLRILDNAGMCACSFYDLTVKYTFIWEMHSYSAWL